ncbi:MAG TPA: V-type ATP synthase subunit F [Spirochaetia bacterium]|nr:V-type ATP synthase subunit F [Spirochaetales bacterium]HRY81054.1 V-type ATP synthase subunit F [Spirochaetia bacterium]HRZ89055.1 V-type ATP synthase subunit F [Spirochaetia bacterium]
MKYYVIGDEDAVLGFGLAGVRGRRVRTSEEASAAFREALEDRENAIILVTERIAELIRPQVDRYVFKEDFPLIVEIPDWEGKLSSRPPLRETVNAAIGIKL